MTRVTHATYARSPIPGVRGNPLAEAIPPALGVTERVNTFASIPEVTEEQRVLPDLQRLVAAKQLRSLVVPHQAYRAFYEAVYPMLIGGYIARNPLDPAVVQWHYDLAQNRLKADPTTGESLLVYGLSGTGKSTMVRRVLGAMPQVIEHTEYDGHPFRHRQLVYLQVDVPPDASRKALCLAIMSAMDTALSTDLYKQYSAPRVSVDAMQTAILSACRTAGLGLLVVDELQNLNVAKGGGREAVLQFFDSLANQAGVPVLKIGTPAVRSLFLGQFCSARRASTAGEIYMGRLEPHDEEWRMLVEFAWDCQWVRNPIPLDEDLMALLHTQTQGIPACLLRLLELSNAKAITSGKERIDGPLLHSVYKESFSLMAAALTALRCGEVDAYEDLTNAAEWFETDGQRGSLSQALSLARSGRLNQKTVNTLKRAFDDYEVSRDLSDREKRLLSDLQVRIERQFEQQGSQAASGGAGE